MLFNNLNKVFQNLLIRKLLFGYLVLLVVVRLTWLKSFVLNNIKIPLLNLIVILLDGLLDILDKNVYYLMNFVELQFLGKNF